MLKINKNPLITLVTFSIAVIFGEKFFPDLSNAHAPKNNIRFIAGPANAIKDSASGDIVSHPPDGHMLTYAGIKKINPVLNNLNAIPTPSQAYAA